MANSFNVRINADDDIDLAAFDEAARERQTNREELVRQLMRSFLQRLEAEENYYTIKGRYTVVHDLIKSAEDSLKKSQEEGF